MLQDEKMGDQTRRHPAELRMEDLDRRFGSTAAVSRLNLVVEAGSLVALLGPSGCGKTTTLRMIAGFEPPDHGRIVLAGRDITGLPPHHRALGMVFQNYSLFPHKTVGENVAFGLRMAGMSRADRDVEVRRMLDLVKLSGYADRYPAQLSGGQQQRVALARSLVPNPRVLLLDEPLGALDKGLRESMQFELRSMQQRFGITTVLVTHDQEEALSMSDRIAVMSRGRILQVGSAAEIYDRPATRFVAEFLGAANIFEGRPISGEGGTRIEIMGLEGNVIHFMAPTNSLSGDQIVLSVRPERVLIGPAAEGLPNRLQATVLSAAFRGTYAAYQLHVPALGREIYAYRQADGPLGTLAFGAGDHLAAGWRTSDSVVVEEDT
jgi:putative spermidine/putrescine transport system ATP-binding protein